MANDRRVNLAIRAVVKGCIDYTEYEDTNAWRLREKLIFDRLEAEDIAEVSKMTFLRSLQAMNPGPWTEESVNRVNRVEAKVLEEQCRYIDVINPALAEKYRKGLNAKDELNVDWIETAKERYKKLFPEHYEYYIGND